MSSSEFSHYWVDFLEYREYLLFYRVFGVVFYKLLPFLQLSKLIYLLFFGAMWEGVIALRIILYMFLLNIIYLFVLGYRSDLIEILGLLQVYCCYNGWFIVWRYHLLYFLLVISLQSHLNYIKNHPNNQNDLFDRNQYF